MREMTTNKAISKIRLLLAPVVLAFWLASTAFAAAPGITSTVGTPTFYLTAQQAYLNQPDGEAVYSWGYGCDPAHPQTTFAPAAPANMAGQNCPSMQVPGPTLIVHENDTVTVNLLNGLPTAAGNTSILFPGFNVTASGGVAGLLTQEALPGGAVTYTFTATAPGTHAYYSGTQGDLQIEMGLYGAIIVLPANVPGNCTSGYHAQNLAAEAHWGETDFRLSQAAYDHPASCYDREYLFQWAEMDSRIHKQAEAQVTARLGCTAGAIGCSLEVQTEPYHPAYFLINGRSMPDLMDPNYASEYPHQPYNGNPHMHPGELTLVRTIGQGRWQHPFHEHANHVRILGRDGNLILSSSPTLISYSTPNADGTPPTVVQGPGLAGSLMFNTDTTPGESFDGIFYFTGRGLNWDPYGHHPPANSNSVFPISSIIETGTTVTVTVSVPGGLPAFLVGQQVTIGGVTPIGYNGPFAVTSVTGSSFTYTGAAGLTAALGGTVSFPANLIANNFNPFPTDPLASLPCTPDANGYNTGPAAVTAVNFFEWCQDHNKPVQVAPFGDVPGGGPATLPDPNVFTNGQWYGGTPYLGPDATLRASVPSCSNTKSANCTTLNPSNTQANPANERGWAFMWHSHNEREITTNNVFPGGMLMMMLVDSREFVIDESQ